MALRIQSRSRLLIAALVIITLGLSGYRSAANALYVPTTQTILADSDWLRDSEGGVFVYYENNGEISCRPATEEEARLFSERDQEITLQVITPGGEGLSPQAVGNLNIILRGTDQLNNFPQARDAFVRAAAKLSAIIQSPITIVIDVDFGPTRFGVPFPPGVLGSASSQSLGRDDFYQNVRTALIAGAGSAQEVALYNALPQGAVPTDLGNTSRLFAPSAALRALGLLPPVADPAAEQAQFGPPPSIGFNSTPAYDFDPRDGITPGQTDFEAVATHEIIHALGFTSNVGAKELNPEIRIALTLLDVFRFRPGAVNAAALQPAGFTDARRILSSGGEQIFFAGGPELALSTGRPDGTGGDGAQAGHWKDDRLTGQTIGIMDPNITVGQQGVITDNDVAALNAVGYGASAADPGGPRLANASYDGATFTIKGGPFGGTLQLKVNNVIVAPPRKIKVKGGGSKLKISGTADELNLRPGANLVQVIRDGLQSNLFVLNL